MKKLLLLLFVFIVNCSLGEPNNPLSMISLLYGYSYYNSSRINVIQNSSTVTNNSSVNLGSQNINKLGLDVNFQILNSGKNTLALLGNPNLQVTDTGSSYSITKYSSSNIASGQASDFTLNFKPTSPNPVSGKIAITTNDLRNTNFAFSISGQTPTEKSFLTILGGSGNEVMGSILQTSDGGYILSGYTSANIATLQGKTPKINYSSSNDGLVIKLDSSGNVDWYTFLGSSGNDQLTAIEETSDKGFIVVGRTDNNISSLQFKSPLYSHTGGFDLLAVKLSSTGNVDWYTFVGGGGNETVNSVKVMSDGGMILSGTASLNIIALYGKSAVNSFIASSGDNFFVVKLNSTGSVDWFSFYAKNVSSNSVYIANISGSGFLLYGAITANVASIQSKTPLISYTGNTELIAIRLDESGNVSWYSYYGASLDEFPGGLSSSSDGGFILSGYSDPITSMQGKSPLVANSGDWDGFVIKIKSTGSVDWYTFIGKNGNLELINSIYEAADGGIIFTGEYVDIGTWQGKTAKIGYSNTGTQDLFVMKLTSTGAVNWYTFLAGYGGNAISQAYDGGYIILGKADANISSVGGKTLLNSFTGGTSDFYITKLKWDGSL